MSSVVAVIGAGTLAACLNKMSYYTTPEQRQARTALRMRRIIKELLQEKAALRKKIKVGAPPADIELICDEIIDFARGMALNVEGVDLVDPEVVRMIVDAYRKPKGLGSPLLKLYRPSA